MELPETIQVLNQRLKDYFGLFDGLQANYRIVWSDDQYENRRVAFTPEGLELIHPEIREVRKYSYIRERFLLEKLISVAEMQTEELIDKLSYECIWNFEDHNGFPLPPKWEAIELIINTIHKNMGKKIIYREPEKTPESEKARVDKLVEDLFGNETPVTDALSYGSGVVVPSNFEKVN